MDTELQNISRGLHVKVKEEKFDDDKSCLEKIYFPQNIAVQNHKMYTELESTKQQHRFHGGEQMFENDKSRFENVECAHHFETVDSTFQNIGNLDEDLDHLLWKNEHKLKGNKDMLDISESNDNIYVSENPNSNGYKKGYVEDDKLVEVMNIKQEVQDHQEQVSVLEDTHYAKHANYDLKFDTSETSEVTVKIENNNLETIDSYLENTTVDLENNCVDIDSKPENGANIYENSDLKLENSVLFNYRLDANYTGSDVKVQATSSIIANVYLKSDFNMSSDLNLDKPDLQSDKVDLNIEKSASGNEARDFMNENIDGSDNTNEPKPILLIKRRPNTVLKKRSEVYHIIQKPICPNKRGHSEVPQKSIRLNTSNVKKQQDLTCKPEILHQSNKLIGRNELGTIDHLQKEYMNSEHTVMPYQCNKCEEVFNTMLKLRNHMISHGSEQPYNCNMCQNGFKTMYELGNHMAIHGIGKPNYLQCSSCEKKFKSKSELRWHMVSHSSERPYKCHICQKGFKRMNNRRIHLIIHGTEMTHQCNICEKKFKFVEYLKRHMVSHSTEAERPHMCDKCSKRFTGLYELKQHMISHSTERPHQCNICEKKFKTMSNLTRHRISHGSELSYTCNICQRGYKRINHYKKHLTSHDSDPV